MLNIRNKKTRTINFFGVFLQRPNGPPPHREGEPVPEGRVRRLKEKHKPHRVSFPHIVRELPRKSLKIYGCCFTLGLSLVMLACLFLSVFARCEQIFREDGGQYDCGVGIGWFGLAAGLAGTGVYLGWMLYQMVNGEGPRLHKSC